MKAADIRHMTRSEIETHIREHKKMLNDKVFNHHITPIESPASIRKVRKDIARLFTVLTEMDKQAATQAS